MSSMKADHRHRTTPHERDAMSWGSTPWYERHRKARAFHRRTTRRALRHAGRQLLATL